MNKQELVEAIVAETGASRVAVQEIVNAVLDTIAKRVAASEAVQLMGFASFARGERAARTGRNPQTGKPVEIAAAETVKFTVGKSFKDAVNGA